MSSLSAMRERPLFSASRRPPVPPRPVAETPPPPLAQPEHPPFTLVGTAIGKTQNVAVILDPTTKNLVRLHSGEAASQWNLRINQFISISTFTRHIGETVFEGTDFGWVILQLPH